MIKHICFEKLAYPCKIALTTVNSLVWVTEPGSRWGIRGAKCYT